MKTDGFKSIGEWRDAAILAGYSVPLPMCHGLTVIMKELDLSFGEAFEWLVREKKIILAGKTYFYDMSTHNAWLQKIKASRGRAIDS